MSRLVAADALAAQTVVVVGGSAGIGRATGVLAASAGANVILISRTLAKVEAAAATMPRARAIAVDFTDARAVDTAFASIPHLHHLVVTAVGDEYALFGELGTLTPDQIEASFDKLRGFVHVARAAAPKLDERGSITFLSGAGARKPPRHTALAAAANGAIEALGRALAVDLAPRRVNVMMPGAIDTEHHGAAHESVAKWARSLPLGYFGQPIDIAEAIVFAMTNPYLTGQTLIVDGGYLAWS
jgi:NAD(P)-dependent dehydrogenase (short-subunit alcohol dehydrogenase family)